MFSVTSLMVVNEAPGMVVPVFKMAGSNLPFVQQMDEFYVVTDMLPFLTSEHYVFTADFSTKETVTINEPGLVAFRSFDGTYQIMPIRDLFVFRDRFRSELQDFPLLNLQVARACGAPRGELHQMWHAVAADMLPEDNRLGWVDSEHQLHQREAQIWRLIGEKPDDDIKLDAADGDASFERLFAWLNRNKLSSDWGRVWIKAFLKRPFDERMLWLGSDWIEARLAELSPVSEIKPVLFLLLEAAAQGEITDEMRMLIREYVMSKDDEFYDFYFPVGFLFHLVRHSYFHENEIATYDVHARDAPNSDVSFLRFLHERTSAVDRLRDELQSALRVVLYGEISLQHAGRMKSP
jgi:hypothetical protein